MNKKINTSENELDQAKQFAITDIGLTEFEAEQAVNDFYPHDDNRYCETCGKILIDFGKNKNCLDMFDDDYCINCFKIEKENFKKMTGYDWDTIDNIII